MTDETRALIEAEKNAPAETQIAGAFQDKKPEPVKTDELIESSINTGDYIPDNQRTRKSRRNSNARPIR